MSRYIEVFTVFNGSDGDATRKLYQELEPRGPAGVVAVNLFRACKTSGRAKVYRGGGYRGMAYDRKEWSLRNLTKALAADATALGITWGWAIDEEAARRNSPHQHVLYIDLPTGQVSFHSGERLDGPDYAGAWDGVLGKSPDRIVRFCVRVLGGVA